MLIEAAVAYAILTLGIAVIIPIFQLATTANERSQETLKAAELAEELMEEVKLRRWDESSAGGGVPTGNPSISLGVDSGENSADKTTFDDVDDFNGWTEPVPKDPLNHAIPGLAGYSRTVTVQYVTSSLAASATPTNYKQVTVCVAKSNVTRACLNWVATNY